MDVMGVDMSVREGSSAGYAMEFRAQGMGFDFYKSIAPGKPIFDSEWHGIGINTALSEEGNTGVMSAEYVNAAMWHAYLHGLRGMETWFWSRYWGITLPDLEPAREFFGSILTMPHVLNAHAQASLALRRLAKDVVPFAQSDSRVKLFFAEPSRLLSSRYSKELATAYEGLCFLDSQVRFLTDTQAAKGVPADTALIVVPYAPYVGDAAYAALLAYARAGGALLLVGEEPLAFSERGEPRDISELKKCPSVHCAAAMSREQYRVETEERMTKAGVARPVRVLDTDGGFADKIESRTVRRGGGYLTYLLNLDTKDRVVTLMKEGVKVRTALNMISAKPVEADKITMKKLDVLLLSIE